MTVDVDGWSSLLSFYSVRHDPSEADLQVRTEKGILRLLELFREVEVKTTFFVTGRMAQRHASVLKEVRNDGHEIACHGLSHLKNEFLGEEHEQRRRIEKSTRIIEDSIGERPQGFRAPCLRVNEATLRSLEKSGYIYDSSVVSTFIPGYYGFLAAPSRPYHPSFSRVTDRGSASLIEIPISVNPFLPLPLSAAWLRNLGSSWAKLGIKANFAIGTPVVLYVHPRDVLSLPRVNGVPWHLYRNVGSAMVEMLTDVIGYAKRSRAKFLRAVDLARRFVDRSV